MPGKNSSESSCCCSAVALAFKEQVAEGTVPKTENDVDMDVLVLPGEMVGCSERGKAVLRGS